jgi:hypothetical protein
VVFITNPLDRLRQGRLAIVLDDRVAILPQAGRRSRVEFDSQRAVARACRMAGP